MIFCSYCDRGRTLAFDTYWEESGIPGRFYSYSIESSPADEQYKQKLGWVEPINSTWTDEDCDRWDLFNGSWLLWGSYGVGKTGLAIGHARLRLKVDEWVPTFKFLSMPDFLSELRDTYRKDGGSELEVIKRYAEPDLLILDDLGAEHVKDSGWLEDRLYQLIGKRHSEMNDTIFTSNLSPVELGDRIGERNMWRIIEMCGSQRIVHVEGKNLRQR